MTKKTKKQSLAPLKSTGEALADAMLPHIFGPHGVARGVCRRALTSAEAHAVAHTGDCPHCPAERLRERVHWESFAMLNLSDPSVADVEKFLLTVIDARLGDHELIGRVCELSARLRGGE
jgi:hypothetical protein